MDRRLFLHQKLVEAFPGLNVYYRPPASIIKYPCVIYEPERQVPKYVGNRVYNVGTMFEVKVLSVTPGIDTESIFGIGRTNHKTTYTSDNIVHDIFTISVNTI